MFEYYLSIQKITTTQKYKYLYIFFFLLKLVLYNYGSIHIFFSVNYTLNYRIPTDVMVASRQPLIALYTLKLYTSQPSQWHLPSFGITAKHW